MKNEPIKLKSFSGKTKKFNMYLWLKGRWNVLEDSYISIAFKTKNTITEYENAHASIALTDNNNNILFAKCIFKNYLYKLFCNCLKISLFRRFIVK